ncbi:hypothetical protein PMI05_05327 [Brevibacillus sp. BC25]|nr:hypothetical protein PMI05_05327 [Brevibacillus sp. BC25]
MLHTRNFPIGKFSLKLNGLPVILFLQSKIKKARELGNHQAERMVLCHRPLNLNWVMPAEECHIRHEKIRVF